MFILYHTCTTGNTCKIYKNSNLASTQIFFVSIFRSVLYIFSLIFIDFLVGFFSSKEHGKSNTMAFTGVLIEYPSMMRYISDWIFTDISFGVYFKVTLKVYIYIKKKEKKEFDVATVRCMVKTCCFQCPLIQSVIRNWQDQCDFNQETKYLLSFAFMLSKWSLIANGFIRPWTSKHRIIF